MEAGEVERLAENDSDAAHLRDAPAGWQDLLSVDHGDRDDGNVCLEDHAGHSGATAVHPTVRAAGSLRINAQLLSACEHSEPRVEGCFGRLATGPVDREHTSALEEGLREETLETPQMTVVALG